ncbi:MAG: hinT [Alphaproteobacteria bacterium]|nr:hinT [Alphaproteobacteria bacterium]
MAYDVNNVFAKILRGEMPAERVYEDDHVLAIKDIHPKAPTHVLVLPKGPYTSLMDFSIRATVEEMGYFFQTITKIAERLGLNDKGFRLVSNIGADAGQIVPHFHVHLLGGKQLGSMAGDSDS